MDTIVLMIGDRFFYGFGKNKRLKTAWSLAGAAFFIHPENNGLLKQSEKELNNKSVIFARKKVVLEGV